MPSLPATAAYTRTRVVLLRISRVWCEAPGGSSPSCSQPWIAWVTSMPAAVISSVSGRTGGGGSGGT